MLPAHARHEGEPWPAPDLKRRLLEEQHQELHCVRAPKVQVHRDEVEEVVGDVPAAPEEADALLAALLHALREHAPLEVVEAQLLLLGVDQAPPGTFVALLVAQLFAPEWPWPPWPLLVHPVENLSHRLLQREL